MKRIAIGLLGFFTGASLALATTSMAAPPSASTCTGLTGNEYVDCRYSELDEKKVDKASVTPSSSPSATPSTIPTPTPSATTTQPANTVRLKVQHSKKYLGFNSSGQTIQVSNGVALELVQNGSSTWRMIKEPVTGKCLDAELVREGRPTLATCNVADTGQRWDMPTATVKQISPTGTNFALDVESASTADNAIVELWTKYSSTNQYWSVESASPSTPSSSPSTTPSASSNPVSPSGEAMPSTAPAGWVRTFSEDFTTDQARGTWPGAYSAKWYGYDCSEWGVAGGCDTSKVGDYDRKAVVSAESGVMNYYVHTGSDGLPKVAAEGPKINGTENSQLYGRYTVRWRADNLPLYKNAWLLWPSSNNWDEGEIDYPEGELDATIEAFNHCPGDPAKNCAHFSSDVGMSSGWHTSTIEWKPGSVEFFLDGRSIGKTTNGIPNTPFRWVLQTETNLAGTKPAAGTKGNVQVDWVTVERLT